MLDVGLCMAVKNEEANIVQCLAPIRELFAEIVIIDTGSTDHTCDLLESTLGIVPLRLELDESQCLALSPVRNEGFDRLSTPWLMTLDADERIDPAELARVFAAGGTDLPSGLFCRWDTDFGDGVEIEDYKLMLFRSEYRHRGLIHDTAQPSLRDAGDTARWLPGMRVRHFPDPGRRQAKDRTYQWRLACAAQREPEWLRYRWFSGYMAYRKGRLLQAERLLRSLHEARPALFPVESLNASMVLAAIKSEQGERSAVMHILTDAMAYYSVVSEDFEVRVNFRLAPWLRDAHAAASCGKLDAIRPYPFPY